MNSELFSPQASTFSECRTVNRYSFSCYDKLDSKWMQSAEEIKDVRIYVSDQILDWMVEYINTNILNEMVRATVKKFYHHNLDGDVYLFKFYQHVTQSRLCTLRKAIEAIKCQLQYKMPWKRRLTYFVEYDWKFANRNKRIREKLENQNLINDFKTFTLDVNWFRKPTIVIYVFSEYLTQHEWNKIDLVFERESESPSPIFICHQFEWLQHGYIEIDEISMDIFTGEWRYSNLVRNSRINDILNKKFYYYVNELSTDRLLEYYNISNYVHFSESYLLSLLNNSYTQLQTYKIQFDQEFVLKDDCEPNITASMSFHSKRTKQVIVFELENCIESNVVKLANFVKHLIKCVRQSQNFRKNFYYTEISISFTNCRLDDYSFLTNISQAMQSVRFRGINFVCVQLEVISHALAAQKKVIFENCRYLTDNDVMTLLENIEFNRLCIEGTNSFTPLLFYMMAEYLMNKEDVSEIQANRFEENMGDCNQNFEFDYNLVYFVKESDKIVARNCKTQRIVDLSGTTDGYEDRSFDISCNVYNE